MSNSIFTSLSTQLKFELYFEVLIESVVIRYLGLIHPKTLAFGPSTSEFDGTLLSLPRALILTHPKEQEASVFC